MPKRMGFLYDIMCDKEFIRNAIIRGARKKHKRWDVKMVLADIDGYVNKMYDLVTRFDYIPTQPKTKQVYDPSSEKTRPIGVQPFYPDGIMQQMVVAAMMPVLMKGMHYWCCASIPNRGGKHALTYAKRVVQKNVKKSKYTAELDVKQFYPSTPQAGVMKALSRKIKDRKFLLLVAVIISCDARGLKYALENNLTTYDVVKDKVGMYIGFYINQWLENFYLESVDRLSLKQPGVFFEYRYMDNIYMFGNNKKHLHKAVKAVATFMYHALGLVIKRTWQVYLTAKRLVSTVGYRVGRQYVIMRKRNFLRFTRQCRRVMKKIKNGQTIQPKLAASILSRMGQLKHCNSFNVRKKYVDPIGVKRLKEVIRAEARRKALEYKNQYLKGATI